MSGPKHMPSVLSGPCPTCKGDPTSEHWDAPYMCPDCGGTGKAETSVSANERLRRAAPRLAAALKRCDSEAVWDDLVDMWLVPNEVMDEIRAALRETGVE